MSELEEFVKDAQKKIGEEKVLVIVCRENY